MHGHGLIHWSMSGLPMAAQQKNNYSTSSRSNQLPIAHLFGVGPPCKLLTHLYWSFGWLDLVQILCRQPQLPWVHECSSHVISWRQHSSPSPGSSVLSTCSSGMPSQLLLLKPLVAHPWMSRTQVFILFKRGTEDVSPLQKSPMWHTCCWHCTCILVMSRSLRLKPSRFAYFLTDGNSYLSSS